MQAWAEKFISSLRYAAQARETYDSGPFSNLDEAQMLNNRDVITTYKNCERTGGRRLLVFGLLGTRAPTPDPGPSPSLSPNPHPHPHPHPLTLTLSPSPSHPRPLTLTLSPSPSP